MNASPCRMALAGASPQQHLGCSAYRAKNFTHCRGMYLHALQISLLQRTYKELHPYRSDEYLPFTSIDCDILADAGFPQPQDLDDFLPLRDVLRAVASEAVAMFKSKVQDSHCRPEPPEDFPQDSGIFPEEIFEEHAGQEHAGDADMAVDGDNRIQMRG